MIAIVDKTARMLRDDMITAMRARGYEWATSAHNPVFATLPSEGARSADMAERAGITRQSMGEVLRDLTARGVVEMVPDPNDGRAKIVRFTDKGIGMAQEGFEHITDLDQLFREKFGVEDYETCRRVLAGIMELLGNDQFVGQTGLD